MTCQIQHLCTQHSMCWVGKSTCASVCVCVCVCESMGQPLAWNAATIQHMYTYTSPVPFTVCAFQRKTTVNEFVQWSVSSMYAYITRNLHAEQCTIPVGLTHHPILPCRGTAGPHRLTLLSAHTNILYCFYAWLWPVTWFPYNR